jgi:nitric oxide reductase subunit B
MSRFARDGREPLPISSWWFQGAILTYLIGFSILGVLAYVVYQEQPPIPDRVVTQDGKTIFTREDILDGMNVFQRYGIMEYGSVYGHGAYLGPDFTADYLHRSAELLARSRSATADDPIARAQVVEELKQNSFDQRTATLTWSAARAASHAELVNHYKSVFQSPINRQGGQAEWIRNPKLIEQLSAFFGWTAWTAAALRPGTTHSYTNNWPPDPLAGNTVTADAVTWSVISIIALLGGAGAVLYFFGRYDWLGWKATERRVKFRPISEVKLTTAQRAVVWFLLVSSLLFVIQTLLGGLAAHYRAEPDRFFGLDLPSYLPFNVARTWHLQLAIFWVSASYLATAIFITPFIAGTEPRGQAGLTILLIAAVGLVVFGSMAGEYASVKGWLDGSQSWFWIGHQGWEYLDLGRLWQILLVLGLFLWVAILGRGLKSTLRRHNFGNMPWLLFYAALAIPAFYAVGLLANSRQGFVVTDFWRFWVVHLWVEDFLELFTTVVVAYMFVLLGMVRTETALRVIYLDIILYSMGGVIGTMHHLYFSGTPVAHMALGATFSAMEVIPLLLLTLEAWGFMKSGDRSIAGQTHLHRWAVWFLVAVGVWNFFGAGVFGFLINLPIVSYYEIGTNLTANHGHTAMMGVYGMLAAGLLLFCLRYLTRPDMWSDRAAGVSFWSLNIGLAWMAFCNLFPVGIVQLHHAVADGYWKARSFDFLTIPWVNTLEWLRLPGDALFIAGGSLPLLWLCLRAVRYPNPVEAPPDTEAPAPLFTEEINMVE